MIKEGSHISCHMPPFSRLGPAAGWGNDRVHLFLLLHWKTGQLRHWATNNKIAACKQTNSNNADIKRDLGTLGHHTNPTCRGPSPGSRWAYLPRTIPGQQVGLPAEDHPRAAGGPTCRGPSPGSRWAYLPRTIPGQQVDLPAEGHPRAAGGPTCRGPSPGSRWAYLPRTIPGQQVGLPAEDHPRAAGRPTCRGPSPGSR